MFWVKKAMAAGFTAVLLVAVGFGAGVSMRQGPVAVGRETPGGGAVVLPPAALTPPGPPGPAKEKKVLTPEQIFRDGFVGEARVEFTVGAVSLGTSPFVLEEAVGRPRVPTADGKFTVTRLQVIMSEKVEARLRQLGIKDLQVHFYKKTVRVAGNVKQTVDAGGVGNRLITYSLTVENLDQLELVAEPAGDKRQSGTPGGR